MMVKDCTESEFDTFVTTYPRKLETYVTGISEPPTICYLDRTLGSFDGSVVATKQIDDVSGGATTYKIAR